MYTVAWADLASQMASFLQTQIQNVEINVIRHGMVGKGWEYSWLHYNGH